MEKIQIADAIRALEELAFALARERARSLYEPGKGCPTVAFWTRMEKENKFWEAPEDATLADLLRG